MPISPHAIVDPQARIAGEVDIGPFSIVHAGVEIATGTRIGSFCEIGVPSPGAAAVEPLSIGPHAHIRSHSVLYAGSRYGAGLETGHRVTLREGTRCGEGVRIGTLSDVQGDCVIGDYVRMHSSVFVAKGCEVRQFAWLLPRVVLTNDPTPPSNRHHGCIIDEYAVVAAAALILPGVTVGARALVAASACVGIDVPPGMVVMGVPARVIGEASTVRLRGTDDEPAYPWTRHFHRGYPGEVVLQWCADNLDEETTDGS